MPKLTFIAIVENSSITRGYNRTVTVHRMKNNAPEFVGIDDKIDTASYKGDYAIACYIINKKLGHKLKQGGYKMESDNIAIHLL